MKDESLLDPGFKTLTRISIPIMYSFFSILGMLFADRMFVNWYSVDALAAVTSAGSLAWAAIFFAMQTGVCSEVFVAQYNGAQKRSELGKPVWQLVWFSVFLIPFYLLLGFWGGEVFFKGPQYTADHKTYFSTMMLLGPISGMNAALGGFYIGQGKVKVVQNLTILGNLINVVLDPIMINGVAGLCPEMGVFGAAVATVIGGGITTVGFLYFMLKPENIDKGARDVSFDPKLMLRCLRVGLPSGIFQVIDMVAWGLFYLMMDFAGSDYILVAGVCQSILILLLFPSLGIEKGVMTIAGNLIGAGRLYDLDKLIASAFKWLVILSLWAMIPLGVFPTYLLKFFSFNNPEAFSALESVFVKTLFIMGLHLVFESVKFIYKGLLMSAGDTLFILVFGSIGVWVFMAAPTYYCLFTLGLGIEKVMWIVVFYSVIQSLIYYLRFQTLFSRGANKLAVSD